MRGSSRIVGGRSRPRPCRAPADRARPPPRGPRARSARPAAPAGRDRPARASSASRSETRRGARPTDGSSSSSTRGAAQQRAATASICRSPPDSIAALVVPRARPAGGTGRRSPSIEKTWRPVVSSGGRTSARFSATVSSAKMPLPSGTSTSPRRGAPMRRQAVRSPAPASRTVPRDRWRAARPAGERVDQRALARAVGADHADHLARGHGEIDAVDRDVAAVGDGEARSSRTVVMPARPR